MPRCGILSLALLVGASAQKDDMCCACSKGTDMGSDLVRFSGVDGQSCDQCCEQAPELQTKHYTFGKSEAGKCSVSDTLSTSCGNAAASVVAVAPAEQNLCCACSKGTDMGSDLVSFSGADGQSCDQCCEQAPELLSKHYQFGKSEAGKCAASDAFATSCGYIVAPVVQRMATSISNSSARVPSDCCPSKPQCDVDCCESKGGSMSACLAQCANPPSAYPDWKQCVAKNQCDSDCCDAQPGNFEDCINQKCCNGEMPSNIMTV